MIVMSFDLSTKCIGIIAVNLNIDGDIILMKSCPVFPPKFDVTKEFGYMKSKKKLPTPTGKELNVWAFKGEELTTQAEKKKRDSQVRSKQNLFFLGELGASIGVLIEGIKPDLILVEKNAIFNGILTTELLAKLMGTLIGIAGVNKIKLNEYRVQTVRKKYQPAKLVKEFSKKYSQEHIASLPDVTKAALREIMQEKYSKYGLELHTDDEADACVVFDYWYEEIYKKGEK